MNRILILITFLLYSSAFYAQTSIINGKDHVKIPFQLINDVILIDVICNNVKLKMIFDTGSNSNIVFSSPEEEIEFKNSRKISLSGLGIGETINAHLSKNNYLQLDGIEDTNFEILIITDQNIEVINKFGIEIYGVIGTSFFKNYLLEINYQNKYLEIYKSTNRKINRKKRKYEEELIEIVENKPFLKLKTKLNAEKTIATKLLIDSGLGDSVWLFENDSVQAPKLFIDDFLGRGLSGDIQGKRARINTLKINKFVFEDALISFPDVATLSYLNIRKDRNGSVGGSFLKRFNWILDFSAKKVYLKKNNQFNLPFNYNMSGFEIEHDGSEWVLEKNRIEAGTSGLNINDLYFDDTKAKYTYKYLLKPIYKVFSVRANSPAGALGIQVGDLLLSVNKKNTQNMTLQELTSIFKSKEAREITIEIRRNKEVLQFIVVLKKQI